MKNELLRAITAGILLVGLSTGRASAQATLPASPCTLTPGSATCEFWARTAIVPLPGTATATSVPIWGYATSAAGTPTLPGPPLIVNQGDQVSVTLHNDLPQGTALHFQGQDIVPDDQGVAAGGAKTYTFTVSRPGTYLYEAAPLPNAQHQTARGLFGALVVRPLAPDQAYEGASTAFDGEVLVVLSELDPVLNASTDPASFDMRNYKPRYFLINGSVHAGIPEIPAAPGSTLLLRYVNAGLEHHSMALLGVTQSVIATGGNPRPFPSRVVAETIAPGETMDALVTIPPGAPVGTRFALYDGDLSLHNSANPGMGGMLTFITATGTPPGPGDVVGPVAAVSPFPATSAGTAPVTVTATVSDVSTGGSSVDAAEYFVDALGAPGTGTTMSGTFGSPTAAVSASLATGSLATGTHNVYVRGRDSAGNWGSPGSAVLKVDRTGPTTLVALAPNPSNGTVDVVLSASADDRNSGGSNVTRGEYFIGTVGGPGSGTPMAFDGTTPENSSPSASLTATLSAATVNALATGATTVSVRSQDALGNWGAVASVALVVDRIGPSVATLSAAPNPNNGNRPFSASVQAVRVNATLIDESSAVDAVEGFIDATGAPGTGFPFVLVAGPYADIPLSTIAALTSGTHPISVRGKDKAGNWGPFQVVNLLVDKLGPTVGAVSLTPPVANASAVSVSAPASDVTTGNSNIAGGELFVDTIGVAGTGMTMAPGAQAPSTTLTGTIPAAIVAALAAGNHQVHVRARDAAGNWGATSSATLVIDRTPAAGDSIFANGFESGNTSGWSAVDQPVPVTTAAAMVGSFGMAVAGNGVNYVQNNFSPAAATYDARFYFRPNGNSSTNQDILSASSATTGGNANFNNNRLFRVRYRWNGGTPQVQIQLAGGNGNGAWTGILGGTSSNYIEVLWQAGNGSPNSGSLRLYVNGTLRQTLATGSAGAVARVRLGSVTNGGDATPPEHFDAFASKRSLSPLIGP